MMTRTPFRSADGLHRFSSKAQAQAWRRRRHAELCGIVGLVGAHMAIAAAGILLPTRFQPSPVGAWIFGVAAVVDGAASALLLGRLLQEGDLGFGDRRGKLLAAGLIAALCFALGVPPTLNAAIGTTSTIDTRITGKFESGSGKGRRLLLEFAALPTPIGVGWTMFQAHEPGQQVRIVVRQSWVGVDLKQLNPAR